MTIKGTEALALADRLVAMAAILAEIAGNEVAEARELEKSSPGQSQYHSGKSTGLSEASQALSRLVKNWLNDR